MNIYTVQVIKALMPYEANVSITEDILIELYETCNPDQQWAIDRLINELCGYSLNYLFNYSKNLREQNPQEVKEYLKKFKVRKKIYPFKLSF